LQITSKYTWSSQVADAGAQYSIPAYELKIVDCLFLFPKTKELSIKKAVVSDGMTSVNTSNPINITKIK